VNTNTSRLSHEHECQASASHGRISSPDHVTTSVSARSYTNRNKYHHLWYSNVIIQTSLSSEGKASERKQARSELTACDVINAAPFSATLCTAKNERAAGRNMLIVCSTHMDSVRHRYITTRRFLTFKNRASIYRTGLPLPSRCCILCIFFNKCKY